MNILKEIWGSLLHIVFPEICFGCMAAAPIDQGFLCAKCLYHLPFIPDFDHSDNTFKQHFLGRLDIQHGAALLWYSKEGMMHQVMQQFKYQGMTKLGRYFSEKLAIRMAESPHFKDIDYIIPIPLHSSKRSKRGYNQSEIIGQSISDSLKIPMLIKMVVRSKKTATQTKKNRIARVQNLKNVFEVADPEVLNGKHVLLVDDVLTTGATLESCALAIQSSCNNVTFSLVTLAMGH